MRTNDDRSTKLRQLLRDYRVARGLTKAAMADAVHLDRMSYLRAERGDGRMLHPGEMDLFCRIIGCDPTALLREAGYTAFLEGKDK